MEEIPFPDLKIQSADFLDTIAGRSKCRVCQKSRKFYCYTCYKPLKQIEDRVPRVKLPIKVDIIKHPSECDGKSTAVHAGVICPDDVTIHTYPCIPDYRQDKTVLVFPGEGSVTLEELHEKLGVSTLSESQHVSGPIDKCQQDSDSRQPSISGQNCHSDITVLTVGTQKESQPDSGTLGKTEERTGSESIDNITRTDDSTIRLEGTDVNEAETESLLEVLDSKKSEMRVKRTVTDNGGASLPIDRVVFIDSTWNQTRSICQDERLKGLERVELKIRKTKFWRHQEEVPDTYLSTIEAIYYFMRDFHENFLKTEYIGEYDNLLFFFTFMYRKIRTLYDGGNELKAYKKRKLSQTEENKND